jgi:hypothetical protein
MRNQCLIKFHPDGCNCPIDNRELFEAHLQAKKEKQIAKLREERRKSIEYGNLVKYWNDRLKNEGQPVPYYEMNQDLKDFRDNGGRFILRTSTQLTLF